MTGVVQPQDVEGTVTFAAGFVPAGLAQLSCTGVGLSPLICAVDSLSATVSVIPTAQLTRAAPGGTPAVHVRFTTNVATVDSHGNARVLVTPWSTQRAWVSEKVVLRDRATHRVLGTGTARLRSGRESSVTVHLPQSVVRSASGRGGVQVRAEVDNADGTEGTGDTTRALTLWRSVGQAS